VDRQTFDALLLEHLPTALRLAVRLCGDGHLAEDLVHDAVVRAVNASRSLKQPDRFRSWFFQIVVNVNRDRLRRRQVWQMADEADPVGSGDDQPPALAAARETGEIVADLVSRLPSRQREVLVLVVYEQMTSAQAAEVLGITDQNARTTLHLARQRLREQLAPYFVEPERAHSKPDQA
jgi:RNA polymerase sigma-70 factor, ECF subfamily